MLREYTCIICPNGCDIRAQIEEREDGSRRICSVEGAACPKGRAYVEQELTDPQRNIATSVLVKGGILPLASVRLTNPIPRDRIFDAVSEIKKYIEDYYLQNRQSPSTTKIAEAVGIARGTAYKYLVEMAEKNMIEYDGQEIRTNVTRKYSGEQTQTPIVGSIPCGSPQYEEENIEEYVSLPTAIFGKGDFFILRASGQSMIDAGIDDGDLVVVKKQVEANDGDIVVALVDNQNTLKRYFRDDENKKIILHPENKKMKDIIVDECCIQGVACHIIKEL